jgi:hypothetical protein
MSGGFLDRLEGELAGLVRNGAHLDDATSHRQRAGALIRRTALLVTLVMVLAASLVSEFPASATGHALLPPGAAQRSA